MHKLFLYRMEWLSLLKTLPNKIKQDKNHSGSIAIAKNWIEGVCFSSEEQWFLLHDPLTFKRLLKAFLPYDQYQNAGIRRRFCWGHGEQWRWNWAGHVLRRQNVDPLILFDSFCTFATKSCFEPRAQENLRVAPDGGRQRISEASELSCTTEWRELANFDLCCFSSFGVSFKCVNIQIHTGRIRRLLVTLVSNVLPSKMVPWTCFRQFRLAATSRDRLQILETKIWEVDIRTSHSSLQQFAIARVFVDFLVACWFENHIRHGLFRSEVPVMPCQDLDNPNLDVNGDDETQATKRREIYSNMNIKWSNAVCLVWKRLFLPRWS